MKPPQQVDAHRWREHDGVVHLLYEYEWSRRGLDAEIKRVTVRAFVTLCDIRLEPLETGDIGGPVYVNAPLTCVVCLAAEGDLDA